MTENVTSLGHVRQQRRRAIADAKAAGRASAGEDDDQAHQPFLPADCPVRPIGVNGDHCYYLDVRGQLREVKDRDHSRQKIAHMFGHLKQFLYDHWPRLTQDKETKEWVTTGWKPELIAEGLVGECFRLGVWSAEDRVRGAGAWIGRDGELVLHCGDELLMVASHGDSQLRDSWLRREPGLVGSMVYPTAPPGLKPDGAVQRGGPAGPAAEALALLETWNWRRPYDAHLLLGWIGAAMLGGALDWRVMAWLTGSKATGKSTLQKMLKGIFGPYGLLQTSDGTAAAIRQITKYASKPVALDEAESEEDNRKMQQLIKLARDAASGSISVRGGQDHQAATFMVRSCFVFSSILIPPLLPQDRSRIAVFELDRLEAGARVPNVSERRMEELGARLLRRLVAEWWRFPATLEAYRGAMERAGHSARGQDLFGTLLACADCLLNEGLPSGELLAGWEHRLAASGVAEVEGDVSDENACLDYLLSTPIDSMQYRTRQSVGAWVTQAVGRPPRDMIEEEGEYTRRDNANRTLADHGMKVVVFQDRDYLAVANMHRALGKLFENSQWKGLPGAPGVWVQALRRLPHIISPKPVWLGSPCRVTLLPVALCVEGKVMPPGPVAIEPHESWPPPGDDEDPF